MVAVTGGGTGGHIFPNVAVIEELKKCGVMDICWIGDRKGKEAEWAAALGISYYGIRTGKLRRYLSLQNLIDAFGVLIGIVQSIRILKRLKPAVLFSKGGFVSVPPAIAAKLLHIPVVTHESDIHPGMATRIIARTATVICVAFEQAGDSFKGKTVAYTGNPVRAIIHSADRKRGMQFLGFPGKLPVVTVLGGSLGASSLNSAVWELLRDGDPPFNLVHQYGRGNILEIHCVRTRYRHFEFIGEEMGDVLAASDLVVSRAGAGALYEIGYVGKPSILVPLPRSKSRGEQIDNARYFEFHQAARIVEDEQLNGHVLLKIIGDLLADGNLLRKMGENASKLCKSCAEREIAEIILRVGGMQARIGS
jgi:UDP-N-acetylglucosamine--N-acetylmuramyl-(pentapeptide) pyrophosphoryl-undecaprenol N-acetylglucosamine transferase